MLLDKNADKKTKAGIRAYFKLLGYKSVKDFVKTAKAQGLDTSKYDYLLKK
ncbi:SPIN family peroxidase inhibitor [Staphylococcus agnetis]|nr:SPIN family peroxidase inhibitor [Staphylococcus agnetis]NJH68626.1 SPIN family peroxidase inhibitor [Staphylococcus agnetis]NJH79482.1 SPIN family peroxidase inhibitor [Staphylococcus agnetis]TRW82678.1 SPIN family peroxidase inhibitor [Staphylococcus agnetis]